MAVSTIGVADAGTPDKYLWTEQRTVSSTAREAQVVLPGEPVYPSYTATTQAVSIATADDHLLAIMGDGTNYTRITRVHIRVSGDVPGADDWAGFKGYRLTTAGTGGTSITPASYDTADSAYGGDVRKLPTSKGTESTLVLYADFFIQAAPTDVTPEWVWTPAPGSKPLIIGPATSAGFAIKSYEAVAACSVVVTIDFHVTSYL